MPFRILYIHSDFARFLLLYVIKYRKKVVLENLRNSFPEKSDSEINKLTKKFYKNLCDILLEGIKGFSMSEKQLAKRYKFNNPELLNEYFEKGHNTISMGAHYANWEWGIIAAAKQLKHTLVALYTSLTNTYIDECMKKKRNKLGTELISISEFSKKFKMDDGRVKSIFFGADQNPSNVKRAHWLEFLNQDTACMTGAEFFARRYKLPVLYFNVQRVKRGHYSVDISVLEANPGNTSAGEITEKYMKTLENLIINKPEDYLWSHRRWKHKREKK